MSLKTTSRSPILRLVYAAVCLALCLTLPFLTGQVPRIGSMLCPMHLPVLLAGFVCGPWWALAVGLVAPLLRHLLLTMPPLTAAIPMTFELAAYGLVSGLLYKKLPKKVGSIYLSLIAAMLAGRILWGVVRVIMLGVSQVPFSWAAFIAGAFTEAIPGILLQIILIPVLVMALRKAGVIRE